MLFNVIPRIDNQILRIPKLKDLKCMILTIFSKNL